MALLSTRVRLSYVKRGLLARILALATVLAVAIPAGAQSGIEHFCRMLNRSVTSCCCKARHQAEKAPAGPSVSDSCCEIRVSPSTPAAQSTRDASLRVAPAALVAVLPVVSVIEPIADAAHALDARARAPPHGGPPLFVKHCALLV